MKKCSSQSVNAANSEVKTKHKEESKMTKITQKLKWRFVRWLTFLAILGSALVAGIPKAEATFESKIKYGISGNANLSQLQGTAFVSLRYYRLSDNVEMSSVTWLSNSLSLGSTEWVKADSYMVMFSSLTQSSSSIRIYTDNTFDTTLATSKTGLFKSSETLSSSWKSGNNLDPAGLFATNSSSWSILPMAWLITDSPLTSSSATLNAKQMVNSSVTGSSIGVVNGVSITTSCAYLYPESFGPTFPAYHFLMDAATLQNTDNTACTSAFPQSDADSVKLKDAEYGIHYAQGLTKGVSYGDTSSPDYIYFTANFTNAQSGLSYRTNIVVETYFE